MYQQHVTENKKNCLPSIMSIVFASFKHLKLPISIKIPVTIPQFFCIFMTTVSLNSIAWATYLITW